MFILQKIFRALRVLSAGSVRALVRSVLLSCLVLLSGSYAIWRIEGPSEMFQNYGDALWYAIVTMTTVGYGDKFPSTLWGRLTGVALMVVGVALLGSALGFIASYLVERRRKAELGLDSYERLQGHILICNYHANDGDLLAELRSELPRDELVVLSTSIAERPEDFDERTRFVSGKPTNLSDLRRAGATGAGYALVLRGQENTDADTILAVLGVHRMNPECHICAELEHMENYEHLQNAGAGMIVSWGGLRNKIFAQEVADRGVCSVITDLLSNMVGEQQIEKARVDGRMLRDGSTFEALMIHLKRTRNAIAIAVEREGKIEVNPAGDVSITQNDFVFYISR
ncbi:MAG: ion transporter [Armatimonadetes bacterium]|nr:ion transporter [Armatimonadota bacterium]